MILIHLLLSTIDNTVSYAMRGYRSSRRTFFRGFDPRHAYGQALNILAYRQVAIRRFSLWRLPFDYWLRESTICLDLRLFVEI